MSIFEEVWSSLFESLQHCCVISFITRWESLRWSQDSFISTLVFILHRSLVRLFFRSWIRVIFSRLFCQNLVYFFDGWSFIECSFVRGWFGIFAEILFFLWLIKLLVWTYQLSMSDSVIFWRSIFFYLILMQILCFLRFYEWV